jgi:phosphoribosylanthranilate isomerase
MKIKVCGMKIPENIRKLSLLQPDYMGFIFYKNSKRFVGDLDPEILSAIPNRIKKVGVFVNEKSDEIERTVHLYNLQAIQLHGDETPETCEYFRKKGQEVIKAIRISTKEDLLKSEEYVDSCDYLLFDTKTPLYGGSGKQYDWEILKDYGNRIPFFLSGGIGPDDLSRILSFHHPFLSGIDLNSKFEREDFQKNIPQLNNFINQLRQQIK